MKISVCIPTYNRYDILLESFSDVYEDERVDDIAIVDDASDLDIYVSIRKISACLPKINLKRNAHNQDCYRNKAIAIGEAKNEWVILLDSDNHLDKSYLDRIFEQEWEADTILTPSFASPNFDFRPYEGLIITKENVSQYIDKPMFEVCLNAANYFVNRDEYLRVWDGSIDPVTSDSIYMALQWLKAGNKIKIVPGLQYRHRVHDGSHYKNNVSRTPQGFHEEILQTIRVLK